MKGFNHAAPARLGQKSHLHLNRLNAVSMADQVVLLDQGKIIANGTHETLLESDEAYQRLIEEKNEFNLSTLNHPNS